MSDQVAVFPGQGAQRPGMAMDFIEQFDGALSIFARASAILPFDVVKLCREGGERLDLTEYTQPCLLTAETAIFAVLQSRFGFAPRYFGGHSLGEYAALVAAGAIPFEIALELVHLRGRLMQGAVPPDVGGMTAIIMDDLSGDEIRAVAERAGVEIANDNSPTQVVLSGEQADLNRACEALARYVEQGMRIVPLTVSAPFHSRWMAVIETEFRTALEAVRDDLAAHKAACVLSNFTGTFHTGEIDDLIEALTRQISGAVRWQENMTALIQATASNVEPGPIVDPVSIVEIGPRRPLRGFFKARGLSIAAVTDVRSAQRVFGEPRYGSPWYSSPRCDTSRCDTSRCDTSRCGPPQEV